MIKLLKIYKQCIPAFRFADTMKISAEELMQQDRIARMNLGNSLTGYKPAFLIGTVNSKNNVFNLALFSSFFHVSSSPPTIGFMMRPHTIERHTLENIQQNGEFTINNVTSGIAGAAHQTSAKYEHDESEFEACGLTPELKTGFKAPFVKESTLKASLKLEEILTVTSNKALLIIGRIHHLYLPDDEKVLMKDNSINHEILDSLVVNGLYHYYQPEHLISYDYAKKGKPLNIKDMNGV